MFKAGESYKKPYKALTGKAKWDDIADLVRRWTDRNPKEMQYHLQYIIDTRRGLLDEDYGIMGGKNSANAKDAATRLSLSLPQELINYIQFFYPTFLDTKEDVTQFKKRFPGLTIPRKT